MSTTPTRRRFIAIIPFAGAALLAACSKEPEPASAAAVEPTPAPIPVPEPAPATAPAATSGLPMVDESDAQAQALGYVTDAKRADTAKYKSYVAGSQCSNCALYMGQPSDPAAGCPLYPGKQVAAQAWCQSWVKKA